MFFRDIRRRFQAIRRSTVEGTVIDSEPCAALMFMADGEECGPVVSQSMTAIRRTACPSGAKRGQSSRSRTGRSMRLSPCDRNQCRSRPAARSACSILPRFTRPTEGLFPSTYRRRTATLANEAFPDLDACACISTSASGRQHCGHSGRWCVGLKPSVRSGSIERQQSA